MTPASLFTQTQTLQLSKGRQEPSWLTRHRKEAFRRYEEMKWPTPRNERWRYTLVGALKPEQFPLLSASEQAVKVEISPNAKKAGMQVQSLHPALDTHEAWVRKAVESTPAHALPDRFAALHAALWSSGTFIFIPKKAAAPRPAKITLTLPAEKSLMHRVVVVAEEESNATLQLEWKAAGEKPAMGLYALDTFVAPNARLGLYALYQPNASSFLLGHEHVHVKRDASLTHARAFLGGRINRSEQTVSFEGEGATATTLSLFHATGAEHVDAQVTSLHQAPHTSNDLYNTAVLDDKSSSVYRGLIKILKEGQQTNSYLTDNTLLLSDAARANTIPALEIDANDVKASHGATLSHVDEQQLFYLQSRGIDKGTATELLVHGFFAPILQKIPHADSQAWLKNAVEVKLNNARP